MRIITLGTGAGRPTLRRGSSATALEYEGEVFLFDCGEGTQIQLMKSSVHWGRVSRIFISHLHGDHVNGLPGLLGTLSLSDRHEPLTVYGPVGLKDLIEVHRKQQDMTLRFELTLQEIQETGVLVENEGYRILTRPLNHVLPCWAYRFEERDRPGRFDVAKAEAEGIPSGPFRAALVRGERITLPDGRSFEPGDFVGPTRAGRVFVHCLDTQPCEEAVEISRGATLLLYEATFSDEVQSDAHRFGHSTAADGARIAKEAGVQDLLLTHISQRYGDPEVLLQEALAIFPQVRIANDLEVFVVRRQK